MRQYNPLSLRLCISLFKRYDIIADNGQDIVRKFSSQDIVHRRSLTIE